MPTDDIKARLQGVTLFQSYDYNLALNNEAADYIAQLEADLAMAVEALKKIKRGDFDESAPRQDMLPSEIAAAALARIKPTVESRNDTKHLLSSPANAKRLRAGIRELKAKPTDDYCGINQEPDEEVE